MGCEYCTGVTTSEPVSCDNRNRFYVYRKEILPECDISDQLTVRLSYAGSSVSVVNPVREVIIPSGSMSAYFYVELGSLSGTLRISTYNQNEDNDCTGYEGYIDCDSGTEPIDPQDNPVPKDCLDINFFWEMYGHKTRLPSWMK